MSVPSRSLSFPIVLGLLATAPAAPVPVQFIDSATGYAIKPAVLTTQAVADNSSENPVPSKEISRSGHAILNLAKGHHTISAFSGNHRPMSGEFEVGPESGYAIRFLMDPIVEPEELRPETIRVQLQEGATLVLGFVVDDNSGEPLAEVQITSTPSGIQTFTDPRGFFRLYVPVPNIVGAEVTRLKHSKNTNDQSLVTSAPTTPVNLLFSKPGYNLEEHRDLEIWSEGNWVYRIRLRRGGSPLIIDERQSHRLRSQLPDAPSRLSERSTRGAFPLSPSEGERAGVRGPQSINPSIHPFSDDLQPFSTDPTNSTIRVPRNIRVLQTNGVTVDYISLDTYCKHVLPAEWIASWASYTGGSNSLNAGAVALRTYAVGYINSPRATNHDICGTTSCQVYRPDLSSAFSDTAVNYTANYLEIDSTGSIPRGLTEYSAENNSLGFSCGDGFTQPTGGCIYDPVCEGATRAGHGRGMCQWGTARWATGRRMAGPSSGDATPNGFPRRDWLWICAHYYPTLNLVKAAPLLIGDDIRALTAVNVRGCDGGTISNGIYCTLLGTKSGGATGVIVGGPIQVTVDAGGTNGPGGFTWYQIQWSDLTVSWAPENFIERVFSLPSAPGSLAAVAAGTNQINVSWVNTAGVVATGTKVERAAGSGGPWLQMAVVATGITNYSDKNLYPGSTWFYRVRAFNPGGNSSYSTVASATTSNPPPILLPIGSNVVVEGTLLSITNSATAPDFVKLISDFEPFLTETANGVVVFRDPRLSGSTSPFLDATPNLAAITDVFSTNGNSSTRALRISCEFTNSSNPWLRLTTSSAATLPNPVIDFSKKLRLSIYSDKPVQLAVGCRETTTAAGTTIGSDGGTTGSSIEWAGVTNVSGTAPMPVRTISPSNWTTVTLDFPNEPIRSFSGGNGILSTASGLGVLEHLAIVPAAGIGIYNIHIDNLAVVAPRVFSWSLGTGAPANASINSATGIFTWTPTETQGPGNYQIAIIATDNSTPPLSATNLLNITVTESNTAPVLAAINDRIVHAGTTILFTNSASDSDIPANLLTYGLETNSPPGALLEAMSGRFSWNTTDAYVNTTNVILVRVTDNGTPPLSDAKTFTVVVLPRPSFTSATASNGIFSMSWSAISNVTYRVQYKDDLGAINWLDSTNLIASGPVSFFNAPIVSAQRFFRISVLP